MEVCPRVNACYRNMSGIVYSEQPCSPREDSACEELKEGQCCWRMESSEGLQVELDQAGPGWPGLEWRVSSLTPVEQESLKCSKPGDV